MPLIGGTKVEDNQGIAVSGDNSGTIIQNFGPDASGVSRTLKLHMPPETAPQNVNGASRFVFTTRYTEFLGRDTEQADLRAFLDREETFRWWLLSGSGGMGKSRLALELCLSLKPNEWHRGFLCPEDGQRSAPQVAAALWETWQPERPTLIVGDYVSERAAYLGMATRILGSRSDLAHPVRFLLVERDTAGTWSKEFRPDNLDAISQGYIDATEHAARWS